MGGFPFWTLKYNLSEKIQKKGRTALIKLFSTMNLAATSLFQHPCPWVTGESSTGAVCVITLYEWFDLHPRVN